MVNDVLKEIEAVEKPVVHVFNKVDRLDAGALSALQDRVRDEMPNAVFVSAVAEDGLEPLRPPAVGRAAVGGERRSQGD